jgi:hypothetical protein
VCFSWYSDIEEELSQRPRQLRLADARRAQEHEAPERAVRILQPRTSPPDRVGDRVDGLVLADDAVVEAFLHVHQLLDLAFHQPGDGNVRPLADHVGDVFLVDLFLQHALPLLQLGEALLFAAYALLDLRRTPVKQF